MKRAIARLVLPLAVLGTVAADAASPPGGLTDVFIQFCGDTRGDADRALQLADAEGWSVPPKSLTMPSFGGVAWIRRQGRWTQAQGVRRLLIVGTLRDPDGDDTLMCSVAEVMPRGMKADLAAVQGALQEWVGGVPLRADDGFAEFAYRESHGLRMAVPPSQDPLANDAPRPPPDVAGVTIHTSLGLLTINYQRSLEGGVGRPFGGAPSP